MPDPVLTQTEEKLYAKLTRMMGVQGVKVEINKDEFMSCVDRALTEVAPNWSETFFISLPGKHVHVLPEDVVGVVKVFEGSFVGAITNQDAMYDPFAMTGLEAGTSSILDMAVSKMINAEYELMRGLSFRYDPEDRKLYLSSGYSGKITAEVLKKITLDNIHDDKYKNWVERFTLACMKELVGRKRSKFTFSNLPLDTDGSTLLNEAIEEQEKLRQSLIDDGAGIYFISR